MYKKRRYNKNPDIIEMIATIIVALVFLFSKLIFKLLQNLFRAGFKINKGSYKINNESIINNPIPKETLVQQNDLYKINNNIISKNIQEIESNLYKKYDLKPSLLTQNEKNFLEVLKQVVGDSYIIENQVQLSRIVNTKESHNYSDFNRIKAKSIDFVLYNKDYKPYLCIELDDLSHLRWDRIKRDEFVNKVMKEVGLKIIHIQASYSYDLEKIKSQIFY